MNRVDTKAEQFYPTYRAENRDILLLEFEEAQKIANGQTKLYGQVTNILLALATFAFTFSFDMDDKKPDSALKMVFSNSIIVAMILFFLVQYFYAILLIYKNKLLLMQGKL